MWQWQKDWLWSAGGQGELTELSGQVPPGWEGLCLGVEGKGGLRKGIRELPCWEHSTREGPEVERNLVCVRLGWANKKLSSEECGRTSGGTLGEQISSQVLQLLGKRVQTMEFFSHTFYFLDRIYIQFVGWFRVTSGTVHWLDWEFEKTLFACGRTWCSYYGIDAAGCSYMTGARDLRQSVRLDHLGYLSCLLWCLVLMLSKHILSKVIYVSALAHGWNVQCAQFS